MKKVNQYSMSLLCTLFSIMSLHAQVADAPVTLKLKRGMILQGTLVDLVPGEYIKISRWPGDTLHVNDSQVLRYTMGVDVITPKFYQFRETGFYQYSTLGMSLTTTTNTSVSPEITVAGGYHLDRWLGLGVGSGIDYYHSNGETIVPIFGELRGYLLAARTSPFYSLRTGYGIATFAKGRSITGARGGFMINPSVGYRLGDGRGLKMMIDIGVKIQHAEFEFARSSERSQADIVYKRLIIRLGFLL